MQFLVRVRKPPPHVALQSDHSDHSEKLPSIANRSKRKKTLFKDVGTFSHLKLILKFNLHPYGIIIAYEHE